MNRRGFLRAALVAFAATTALGRVSIAAEQRRRTVVDATRELLEQSLSAEELIRKDLAAAFGKRVDEMFFETISRVS